MEEKPAGVEEIQDTSEVEVEQGRFTTPPRWEKIKLHKWKILAGALGILVFAGAIFGAYKLGQKQAKPVSLPTPTPTPISTAVPSPTPEVSPRLTPTPSPKPITWKTYTNDTYEFQMKYPAEMVLGPEPKAPDPELLSSRSIYRPEAANSISEGHINITVRSTPLDALVASWERLANRTAIQVNLDGLVAKKIDWVDTNRTDGINLYNQKILFAHNSLTYEISLYIDDNNPEKEEFLGIFNQILFTFRFLE